MRTDYSSLATLVVGVAMGVLIGLRIGVGVAGDIVWGSLGEWVGGLGTALAVWVAAAALIGSRRAEARAQESLQRSNAMAVTVSDLTMGTIGARPAVLAIVENGGSLPIFDAQVDIGVSLDGGPKGNMRLGTIGTGGSKQVTVPIVRKARLEDLQWEVRFRDSHGALWRSRNGRLEPHAPNGGHMVPDTAQ